MWHAVLNRLDPILCKHNSTLYLSGLNLTWPLPGALTCPYDHMTITIEFGMWNWPSNMYFTTLIWFSDIATFCDLTSLTEPRTGDIIYQLWVRRTILYRWFSIFCLSMTNIAHLPKGLQTVKILAFDLICDIVCCTEVIKVGSFDSPFAGLTDEHRLNCENHRK